MVVAIVVICLNFGIILTNQMNQNYVDATGRPLIYHNVTSYMNVTDVPFLTINRAQFNDTAGELTEYNKPVDVQFDFDFYQTIKFAGMVSSSLFYSTIGFPYYLYLNFNMPWELVVVLTVLVGLSYFLLLMKWLGRMDI
jgi:hypothetical protein